MGENFNENLKEARIKSGLSQKEVSENIGVAKSTYSLYESGNREPNVNTIKKIADVLNVSADTLLGIDEEPTTMAAHFDGDEYTEDELDEIRQFAEFVKNKRKIDLMKTGSIGLVSQITTISKIRITKPLHYSDAFAGIKLSDESLNIIDKKICELYIGK